MPQSKIPPESPSLRAEMRAIAKRYPHWHVWLSDGGWIWASTAYCPYLDGSGTTVDGGSPETVSREIARLEHKWHRVAA